MAKQSGRTRLRISTAGISVSNLPGLEDSMREDVTPVFEKNSVFNTFLVDAVRDGFIISGITDNGSIIEEHSTIDKTKSDYEDLKAIARILASKEQSIIQITPTLRKDSHLYGRIYKDLVGTEKEGKCPDIKVTKRNGRRLYEEYESFVRPVNERKVSNMLRNGLIQSPRVIVDIRDGIKMNKVCAGVKGRIGKYDIENVSVFDGKSVKDVYTKGEGFLPPYTSWN